MEKEKEMEKEKRRRRMRGKEEGGNVEEKAKKKKKSKIGEALSNPAKIKEENLIQKIQECSFRRQEKHQKMTQVKKTRNKDREQTAGKYLVKCPVKKNVFAVFASWYRNYKEKPDYILT